MPVMVQKSVGISDFDVLGLRCPVIHQQVVWPFHVVSIKEHETSGDRAKAVAINAVDHIHSARGVQLQQGWRHRLYVFEAPEFCPDFDGPWGAAETGEKGRGWG